MRLLLDEQFPPRIASQLHKRGHDAVAIGERPDLQSARDKDVLEAAVADRRALLTNNVRDFAPIALRWSAADRRHYGLLFTDDASMPRSRNTIGRFVRALDPLLTENRADDAWQNRIEWVRPSHARG